jgi:hypothetical protein
MRPGDGGVGRRWAAAALLVLPAVAALAAASAFAQTGPPTGHPTAGNPVAAGRPAGPAKPSVTVLVMGDSLADGLWMMIAQRYARDREIRVVRGSLAATGFNRTDYGADLVRFMATRPVDLLFIQTGANDRQGSAALDGSGYAVFGTARWEEVYRARVARFLDVVREREVATIWVGLPIMREPTFDRDMRRIDAIHRDMAEAAGVAHVAAHALLAGPDGRYVEFAREATGALLRLRFEDGVHATAIGYKRMADAGLAGVKARFPGLAERLGLGEGR